MKQYLPTISAIRWACKRIQATWSDAERAQRASWAYPPVVAKRVKTETVENEDDEGDEADDDEDGQ